MKNIIFKWFLSYSKKLGYEVSITKETDNTTEYYCNYGISPLNGSQPNGGTPPEIAPNPPVETKPKSKTKRKLNSPLTYLRTKDLDLHNGRGSAMIIQKKINEIVNAINYINNDISKSSDQ